MVMVKRAQTNLKGFITIEKSLPQGMVEGDVGIMVAEDGRIWICVNGEAFFRFKPLEPIGKTTIGELVCEQCKDSDEWVVHLEGDDDFENISGIAENPVKAMQEWVTAMTGALAVIEADMQEINFEGDDR